MDSLCSIHARFCICLHKNQRENKTHIWEERRNEKKRYETIYITANSDEGKRATEINAQHSSLLPAHSITLYTFWNIRFLTLRVGVCMCVVFSSPFVHNNFFQLIFFLFYEKSRSFQEPIRSYGKFTRIKFKPNRCSIVFTKHLFFCFLPSWVCVVFFYFCRKKQWHW